jgi:hypothetical protein
MSEARKCHVCGNFGEPPYTGWSSLYPGGTVHHSLEEYRQAERERIDICSRECHDLYDDARELERSESMTL